jgi:hypothetical protein
VDELVAAAVDEQRRRRPWTDVRRRRVERQPVRGSPRVATDEGVEVGRAVEAWACRGRSSIRMRSVGP